MRNLCGTLALWGYFTAGFLLLFAPRYLAALVLAADTAAAFQRLNRSFYRGFFRLLGRLAPGWRWQIDPRIERIHAAVVVCNHISYLDSILLIALLPRHTTIAKARLFRIPLFGRMLTWSGYIPATAEHGQAGRLLACLEDLPRQLAAGNNLLIFPEGTRGRAGRIGALQPGAFKLARRCRAPICVLKVAGTDRLFAPGRFAFDLAGAGTVVLGQQAVLPAGQVLDAASARALAATVGELLARTAEPCRNPDERTGAR